MTIAYEVFKLKALLVNPIQVCHAVIDFDNVCEGGPCDLNVKIFLLASIGYMAITVRMDLSQLTEPQLALFGHCHILDSIFVDQSLIYAL